jgi:hypothetical protein
METHSLRRTAAVLRITTMKIAELKIAPRQTWSPVSQINPLVCTVKLKGENAIVETVLSEDDMMRMIYLVQGIVADAAKRNVDDFVRQVTSIDATQIDATPPASFATSA